jgi:hypothetical protein
MADAGWGSRREITSGSGGSFCALDFSKLDAKHEFYKLAEGANRIEILPYVAETKLHPLIAKGKREKGGLDYNLDIYVHRNVGASGGAYVCPNKNYGKPCPICEASEAYKSQSNARDDKYDKMAQALFPSRRIFYNVLDNMDRDKGVQIFESNAKYFQKPLEAADKDSQTDTDIQEKCPNAFFPDIKNGLTVKVIGAKESFNGKDFVQASSITLLPRKESVKEYANDVVQFDQCIKLLSYDELEAIFTGAGDDEEEDEAPPPKAKKAPVDDDDEPAPKKKAPVVEEDEPAPKKAKTEESVSDEPTCPHNHAFYQDNDEYPECKKCDNATWKACAKGPKK